MNEYIQILRDEIDSELTTSEIQITRWERIRNVSLYLLELSSAQLDQYEMNLYQLKRGKEELDLTNTNSPLNSTSKLPFIE